MRRTEIILWIAAAVLAVAVTAVCLCSTPGKAIPDGDAATALSREPDGSVAFQLDLNTADRTELMRLPGMTVAIAQEILDYRAYYRRFVDVREIGNVPGVSEAMCDRWVPYLTLGDGGAESSS